MGTITIHQNIIPCLLNKNRFEIDNYRYYLMIRHDLIMRSGVFYFDELCDILYNKYGYKSLHTRKGNDRTKFIQRLKESFSKSFFFEQHIRHQHVTFKIKSINRLTNKKTSKTIIPDSFLCKKNKSIFVDVLLGLRSLHKFSSANSLQQETGYSQRRVQSATRNNNDKELILKIPTYIIAIHEPFTDYRQVIGIRICYLIEHGIITPEPVLIQDDNKPKWFFTLFGPNSFIKGPKLTSTVTRRPLPAIRDEHCWYKPVEDTLRKVAGLDHIRLVYFDENHYSLNDYIKDYGKDLI